MSEPNEGVKSAEVSMEVLEKNVNVGNIRKAESIASVNSSDDPTTDSDSDFGTIMSCSDSDKEFEQYLAVSQKKREKCFRREHGLQLEIKRMRIERRLKEKISDEYEALPDLDKLSIKGPSETPASVLGVVHNIVGCVAIINPPNSLRCEANNMLSLDTIAFAVNGEPIGAICDIMGTMHEAQYCVKLNSDTNKEGLKNSTVYYIPEKEFTTKLTDRNSLVNSWEVENSDEEEPYFSDDQKEKEYYANKERKRQKIVETLPEVQQRKNRRRPKPKNKYSSSPAVQSHPSVQSESRRETSSTEDNPYAEFLMHTDYDKSDISKVYERK